MIISRQLNYIYFAVPKTATHSVREVLRSFSNPSLVPDWEQQILFVEEGQPRQALPFPQLAKLGHGHISAAQLKPEIDDQLWKNSFKFGFVRNPFDRFISVCFFLNRQNPKFQQDPLIWMKSAIVHPRFQNRTLVRPQHLQLQDDLGHIALDYVGRYESLQESMNVVSKALGQENKTLRVKNSSDHLRYQSYYDEGLRYLVANFYRKDLEIFDYKF